MRPLICAHKSQPTPLGHLKNKRKGRRIRKRWWTAALWRLWKGTNFNFAKFDYVFILGGRGITFQPLREHISTYQPVKQTISISKKLNICKLRQIEILANWILIGESTNFQFEAQNIDRHKGQSSQDSCQVRAGASQIGTAQLFDRIELGKLINLTRLTPKCF